MRICRTEPFELPRICFSMRFNITLSQTTYIYIFACYMVHIPTYNNEHSFKRTRTSALGVPYLCMNYEYLSVMCENLNFSEIF